MRQRRGRSKGAKIEKGREKLSECEIEKPSEKERKLR